LHFHHVSATRSKRKNINVITKTNPLLQFDQCRSYIYIYIYIYMYKYSLRRNNIVLLRKLHVSTT
ncbi:MAG: hypothetical protein N7Q72_07010, partial [Spiroplasma sp. Tabriz.8]|nr:hypothetical protein [Candidatus Phytoplasma australiense]MCZ8632996.1 hypothetical protein [Spiroplasma sp. Tabriz.8]